jgi:hypothetical protein
VEARKLKEGTTDIAKLRRWEVEKVGGNGIRNSECGLRPIRAYAYAPAGMRS